MDKLLTLQLLKEKFGVCRLDANADIPVWVSGSFYSVTKTEDELSIVCVEDQIPDTIQSEKN